ncbi:glycosyltransferase family 2 protein [Pseudaquidulcibacter saccharophilus]|uniref:glycosyltransferase family 2 protein n=1 Tax=Pseudaquidulcibacter saccharophilus TaxID=2831900 RepID=UPI001EFEFC13|nr:glycosyltransferase family 2 protein [Pseudaquidulcibacter saccharophilus]
MNAKLSIFIIAKNEGDRIGKTLAAIKGLGDEIIVIDSGSSDDTVAVSESYGAKVIFNEWCGYGEQKRFGEDVCKNDWLLNLDADEVITTELYDEIKSLFANNEPAPQGFAFPIVETFPFETIPHKFAYALSPVRLYNKKIGRYNPSPVHDRVDLVDGAQVTHLKGRVCHYSVRSLGEQIIKLNSYADAQALDLIKRGKKISPIRIVFEFPMTFLKAYIGRRHFLRGVYGFLSAMNFAYYRHLRIAKYFELKLSQKSK